jgi:hypothetical protein
MQNFLLMFQADVSGLGHSVLRKHGYRRGIIGANSVDRGL